MIPYKWLKTCKGRLLALTLGCVLLFCLSSSSLSSSSRSSSSPGSSSIISSLHQQSPHDESPLHRHHPFENACKFPIINSYANDISIWQFAERLRTLKCTNDFPLATMDSEGAMYVHPHYAHYPNKTDTVHCRVNILEGGMRNKTTNSGKNDFKTVVSFDALVNIRFLVNADAFAIECKDKKTKELVWQKPFAGMYDPSQPKNTLIPLADTPNFNNYGQRRKAKRGPPPPPPERLSIDILGFDSTSRSMFQRHMPRTWETMHRLGFEVLYGYNKVGDNSMVNLVPILVGDVPEALKEPKLDSSGDINSQWILPTTKKLDPTVLQFLWKWMREKYGCKSMLNEDISQKNLGLFHYPPNEFQPGFTEMPADHFYRAYYLAVYKDWLYKPCKDGSQVQKEFVDLWYRFANRYKDICHFGFTFVTTLTHEQPFLLEPLDEHISQRLESLNANGVLDNTLSVIMGDHGNRIGVIQYSYSGRIEERMPLMAIRIPPKIRQQYPEQYKRFQENRFKLTSNFDVHQLLVDFAEMKFGEEREQTSARGISIFREISDKRTCFDAYIPENFCSCMVDRSDLKEPLPKKVINAKDVTTLALEAIGRWLTEEGLDSCVESLPETATFSTIGPNALVRHGLRSKENATVVDAARNKNPPKMDFLWHETTLQLTLKASSRHVSLLFRVENDVSRNRWTVNFEPSVVEPTVSCPHKSLFDFCDCLGLL